METTNFGLKLLVDSKAHKVVFGECGKDFIDFLFTILKLPIACFIGQPSCMSVFACLANMILITKKFNDDFMQVNEVDELMTWIITDNLFIAPLSTTTVINVLRTSKTQVNQLQYKTIDFHISDLTDRMEKNKQCNPFVNDIMLSKLTNIESTTEFEVKRVEFGVNE
ncbi:hypothetical protein MTR67_024041, partial [Solanum verrucosum]